MSSSPTFRLVVRRRPVRGYAKSSANYRVVVLVNGGGRVFAQFQKGY